MRQILIIIMLQNIHTQCHSDSPCRHPAYRPSKIPLTDPTVIEVYEKALQDTMIYRHAEYYCRVSVTLIMIYYNNQVSFHFSVPGHILG